MKEYTYKPFADVLSVVPEEALPTMDGITFENDKRPTPYVGYPIAQKNLDEGTYKSGLVIDKGRAWDETEAKKIIDSAAVLGLMPCGLVNKETDERQDGTLYLLPYYLPEHPMFKATNALPVQHTSDETKIGVEVIFAFDEGMIFPAYREYTTVGKIAFGESAVGPGNCIQDVLNEISSDPKSFLRSLVDDHTVSMENVYTQVRLFCSSREGITDYVTLGFDELHCLADSILSIRVIDLSEHDTEA